MLSPFDRTHECLLRSLRGGCPAELSFLDKLFPTVFGIDYNHRLMHSNTAKEKKSGSREGGVALRLGDVAQQS